MCLAAASSDIIIFAIVLHVACQHLHGDHPFDGDGRCCGLCEARCSDRSVSLQISSQSLPQCKPHRPHLVKVRPKAWLVQSRVKKSYDIHRTHALHSQLNLTPPLEHQLPLSVICTLLHGLLASILDVRSKCWSLELRFNRPRM